jgi:hypothetical protein
MVKDGGDDDDDDDEWVKCVKVGGREGGWNDGDEGAGRGWTQREGGCWVVGGGEPGNVGILRKMDAYIPSSTTTTMTNPQSSPTNQRTTPSPHHTIIAIYPPPLKPDTPIHPSTPSKSQNHSPHRPSPLLHPPARPPAR